MKGQSASSRNKTVTAKAALEAVLNFYSYVISTEADVDEADKKGKKDAAALGELKAVNILEWGLKGPKEVSTHQYFKNTKLRFPCLNNSSLAVPVPETNYPGGAEA